MERKRVLKVMAQKILLLNSENSKLKQQIKQQNNDLICETKDNNKKSDSEQFLSNEVLEQIQTE